MQNIRKPGYAINSAIGLLSFVFVGVALAPFATAADEDKHPLSADQRAELKKELEAAVERANKFIEQNPLSVRGYSVRGDAYFFLARFHEAVADYVKMLEIDPSLEQTHWRLGLAYYYIGEYKRAQRLFEKGYEVDKNDRENGIWKFLSQARAEELEKAKKELPKYTEFDRDPLPSVYKLFSDEITPAEILREIEDAKIDDTEREKRRFYAELYIGMNHLVRGEEKPAIEHLRKSVANIWGNQSEGGPNYMWHLARVQYELLTAKSDAKKSDAK
jgi:lipoprotein NlpI